MTTEVTPKVNVVLRLTPQARELLTLMNFHEIPDEAEAVAFYDDGDAQFIEKIEHHNHLGFTIPKMILLSYYTGDTITIK